jgi:hypothetical protein
LFGESHDIKLWQSISRYKMWDTKSVSAFSDDERRETHRVCDFGGKRLALISVRYYRQRKLHHV